MKVLRKTILNTLFNKLFLTKVYAEGDPNDPNPPSGGGTPPQPPVINYEDLIAKARKEEKDKLYPQIEDLKKKITDWTEKNNQNLLKLQEKETEITSLTKQLEDAKKSSGKTDSEEVASLKKTVETLTKELEDAKATIEKSKTDVQEIENKIKAEYEVKLYKEKKLAEANGEIIPELVLGTTKEEIDASFEIASNRYKEIVAKVGVSTPPASGGSRRSGLPSANVDTTKLNDKNFNYEQLANMDVNSAEYIEFRKKMGIK